MAESDLKIILTEILKKLDEQGKKMENIEKRLNKLDTLATFNQNKTIESLGSEFGEQSVDLSTIQWAIIRELEQLRDKWVSIYELSDRLGKSRHYINAYINELEGLGFIKRRPNLNTLAKQKTKTTDKQKVTPRYLYQIDEEGEKLLSRVYPELIG